MRSDSATSSPFSRLLVLGVTIALASACSGSAPADETPAPAPASPPAAAAPSSGQEAAPEGVRNYTRVDATVACAGATEPAALAEIAKRGFVSVVNLRQASEEGANIEESRAAAEQSGLKYIHIPVDGRAPDPAAVDTFLAAVTDESNQPVYIHCGSANRVGAMWLIKRVRVDHWSQEKAVEEAEAIGLTSPSLKQFALDYLAKSS